MAANFVSDASGFLLERADSKIGATLTIAKIVRDPFFETAAALALGDVDQIMHNELAIAPGIDPNDEGVSESNAARILSGNARAPGGFGQLRMGRQRDTVDHEQTDPGTVMDSRPDSVRGITRVQRNTAGENKVLLRFSPLICYRQKSFECFLIDDWHLEKLW